MALEVGYMGNRGVHLQTARSLRYFDPALLSRSPTRDQDAIDYWSGQVPNPFYPLLPGTGCWSASQVTRATVAQMANYPQFTGVSTTDNSGSSWYNALTARL
jgi:hypothetical protein